MTIESIEELKNILREYDEVEFIFTKKDGTERRALGTLKLDAISEEHHPKGAGMTIADDVIRYFDYARDGWRSFRWEQFNDIISYSNN